MAMNKTDMDFVLMSLKSNSRDRDKYDLLVSQILEENRTLQSEIIAGQFNLDKKFRKSSSEKETLKLNPQRSLGT